MYGYAKIIKNKYDWKQGEKLFERTYRRISNLDDRYKNGIQDLLKFIKFGYRRWTNHASKDIRAGYLTRDESDEMVKNMSIFCILTYIID